MPMYVRKSVTRYSGKLTKLKQEGDRFESYQKEFMRLSHQILELLEKFLVGCFINSLRDAIKYDIAKNPLTMEEAMWLAWIEE